MMLNMADELTGAKVAETVSALKALPCSICGENKPTPNYWTPFKREGVYLVGPAGDGGMCCDDCAAKMTRLDDVLT